MKDNRRNNNNNNVSFLLNQLNLFNHQKEQPEVNKQWHCFDKIIFKKIEELQSKAFYYHKGSKLKPIKVRFNNSILNSFKERNGLNKSYGERNRNSQSDHHSPSNSLPYMNYNNNNSINISNCCCHSNRNIKKPEISNSYSMQSYNTKSTDRLNHHSSSSSFIPNLNDFMFRNKQLNVIHKDKLNADLVLVIKSLKTNELDDRSLSPSNEALSNRRRRSNSNNQQCDKSTETPNVANVSKYKKKLSNYPLKRIKLVKGSNFNEKYNVSNFDYTILSKRSPLKKITNKKEKNKDKENNN